MNTSSPSNLGGDADPFWISSASTGVSTIPRASGTAKVIADRRLFNIVFYRGIALFNHSRDPRVALDGGLLVVRRKND